MSVDAEVVAGIFADGQSLRWERAARCSCWSQDTRQPDWNHDVCGGLGVVYTDAGTVKGLFRSQSRWVNPRMEGEFDHGEASLTVPLDAKPGYEDRRVRDRYTVVNAAGDSAQGRVFYPAAPAVPFLFGNEHLAWRVQVTSIEQRDRMRAQP